MLSISAHVLRLTQVTQKYIQLAPCFEDTVGNLSNYPIVVVLESRFKTTISNSSFPQVVYCSDWLSSLQVSFITPTRARIVLDLSLLHKRSTPVGPYPAPSKPTSLVFQVTAPKYPITYLILKIYDFLEIKFSSPIFMCIVTHISPTPESPP